MAKPTKLQRQALSSIEDAMQELRLTNDLHSPSHSTELELIGLDLMEDHGITEAQAEALNEALCKLWVVIAELDKCPNRS